MNHSVYKRKLKIIGVFLINKVKNGKLESENKALCLKVFNTNSFLS